MGLIYRGITIEDRKYTIILSLKIFQGQETEILTWCYENFGSRGDNGLWNISGRWSTYKTVYITFLRETDAMAFRLTWT